MLLILTTIVSLSIRRVVWRLARYRQYERGLETRNVVILGTNHLSYALGQHIANDYGWVTDYVDSCFLRGAPQAARCRRTRSSAGLTASASLPGCILSTSS